MSSSLRGIHTTSACVGPTDYRDLVILLWTHFLKTAELLIMKPIPINYCISHVKIIRLAVCNKNPVKKGCFGPLKITC